MMVFELSLNDHYSGPQNGHGSKTEYPTSGRRNQEYIKQSACVMYEKVWITPPFRPVRKVGMALVLEAAATVLPVEPKGNQDKINRGRSCGYSVATSPEVLPSSPTLHAISQYCRSLR